MSKNLELVFIHADIDSDPLNQIPDNSLDKIIMINAFQDVNPYSALKTFRRIISPKSFFRVNVINREFRDENLVMKSTSIRRPDTSTSLGVPLQM